MLNVGSLIRIFARWPFPVYRLGLGWLIAGKVMILTTQGRKTGMPRDTALWYVYEGRTIYCASRRGEGSQWLLNLRANPDVSVRIGNSWFTSIGSFVTDPLETDQVIRKLERKYQYLGKFLLRRDRLVVVGFKWVCS